MTLVSLGINRRILMAGSGGPDTAWGSRDISAPMAPLSCRLAPLPMTEQGCLCQTYGALESQKDRGRVRRRPDRSQPAWRRSMQRDPPLAL